MIKQPYRENKKVLFGDQYEETKIKFNNYQLVGQHVMTGNEALQITDECTL